MTFLEEVFAEHAYLTIIIWVVVIVAVAAVLELLFTRWLRRFIERTRAQDRRAQPLSAFSILKLDSLPNIKHLS